MNNKNQLLKMLNLTLDPMIFIGVFLYIVIIGFACFALFYEIKDIVGQKHLNGTEWEEDDCKEQIKEKIAKAAKYQNSIIYWRRSYIIAAISSFLLIVLLKNKIPNGLELTSAFLLLYIIIYMSGMIYKNWLTKVSTDRVEELLNCL